MPRKEPRWFLFLLVFVSVSGVALVCVAQDLILSRLAMRHGLQPSRRVDWKEAAANYGWTSKTVDLLSERARQETRKCGFVASEVGHFVRIAHFTHAGFAGGAVFNPSFECTADSPVVTVLEAHEICNTTRRRQHTRCNAITARWDRWDHGSAQEELALEGSAAFCVQRLVALHDGEWPCNSSERDDEL